MTTHKHSSPPARQKITRRDFLGLAGMGALAASVACIGSVIGYLALDRLTGSPAQKAMPRPPTWTPTRPNTLKQIDRPLIITRAAWGAREPNHSAEYETGTYSLDNAEGWREYEGDLRDAYRSVVVHHSVEYETDDLTTMRVIQDLHMDDNKWADIGYHFAVGKTGSVFEGRTLNIRGTHVEGFNTGSVGVVFLGNFEVESPTLEQIDAGRRLIDWLALRLELTHLAGHRDFNEFTKCPGINLYYFVTDLANSAGLIFGTGGYEPPPEQLITPSPEAE